MDFLLKLFTGGWLSGYRTYVLGFVLFAQALGQWAVGDRTGVEFLNQLPEILGGLGLMTLRASVPPKE